MYRERRTVSYIEKKIKNECIEPQMSDFVFLCLCLLTHIWSVLFPIIS